MASIGRLSRTGAGAGGGRMPAQLVVMVMKTAHAIGRQRYGSILGFPCLLDGCGGGAPDLDLGISDSRDFAAYDQVAVTLRSSKTGVGLGRVRARAGDLEPASLQIERIPAQAQRSGHDEEQRKRGEACRNARPGWKPPHAG